MALALNNLKRVDMPLNKETETKKKKKNQKKTGGGKSLLKIQLVKRNVYNSNKCKHLRQYLYYASFFFIQGLVFSNSLIIGSTAFMLNCY